MKDFKTAKKLDELFNVKERVILVTGPGGLGRTLALGYAVNGAQVVLAGNTPGKAQVVVDGILEETGFRCAAVDFDQRKKSECENLIARIVKDYGRLDVLVNTAGIGRCYPPEDFPESEVRSVLEVNLTSAIFITQAAGQAMIRQKDGKIVHIGSIAGIMTHTYESMVYESSKAALHQMIRSFAIAWGKYNINVNCIAPTWINTPMLAGVPMSYYENVAAMHTFERIAEPDDFVGAALFLSSDASHYITGHILLVDGGWTAGRPLSYDKNDPRTVTFDGR